MENSIFIARIFGIFYLVAAVGMMFNRQFYQRLMEDYSKNAAGIFFSGALALIIGLVIVLTHNIWVANWTVIITLLGWIALVKGIWIIVFPDTVSKVMQAYREKKGLLTAHSILALLMGILLTVLGYAG